MARPVVALLTDFGTADHYAGTMKGVVLTLCPDVTLVDISHDVPAHDHAPANRADQRNHAGEQEGISKRSGPIDHEAKPLQVST